MYVLLHKNYLTSIQSGLAYFRIPETNLAPNVSAMNAGNGAASTRRNLFNLQFVNF